jgi:hypothetical protein
VRQGNRVNGFPAMHPAEARIGERAVSLHCSKTARPTTPQRPKDPDQNPGSLTAFAIRLRELCVFVVRFLFPEATGTRPSHTLQPCRPAPSVPCWQAVRCSPDCPGRCTAIGLARGCENPGSNRQPRKLNDQDLPSFKEFRRGQKFDPSDVSHLEANRCVAIVFVMISGSLIVTVPQGPPAVSPGTARP